MQRRIVLMRVEPNMIPDAPGRGSVFNLDRPLSDHGDAWQVISHSINFNLDGALILSVVLEGPDDAGPSIDSFSV